MQAEVLSPSIQQENSGPGADWVGLIVALIAGGWIWLTAVLPALIIWGAEQVMTVLGYDWPFWARPLSTLIQACLLLIVIWPLAHFWNRPRYKGVFRFWLWATVGMFLFIPLHFVHYFRVELASLIQSAVLLILALLISRRIPKRNIQLSPHWQWPTLGIGALISIGWLVWGAFGTWQDILFVLISTLLFGWVCGLLIGRLLMPALHLESLGSGWDMALGGFALTNGLLILGMAYGWSGQQVLIFGVLWLSGWLMMGLVEWGGWKTAVIILPILISIPLATVDNDELILTLFEDPILRWTGFALLASIIVGLVAGIILFFLRNTLTQNRLRHPVWRITALVGWGVALVLFFVVGQPGTHGDRAFVILKEQADVSTAVSIGNYTERRTFVYDTLVNHANSNQANLRRFLDRLPVEYTPYYLVNAIEVEAGPILRLYISTRPEVDRVIDSPVLRPLPAPLETDTGTASAPTEPQWNLTQIGATRVWEEFGVRGQGIVIGQSDSGAEWTHPELKDSYRGRDGNHSGNWLDPYENRPEPFDHGGHGTHTLGSVLGNSVGVAPEAEWYACANLDRNLGNPAVYLDCMQFMLAPYLYNGDPFLEGDPSQGAHVMNNSWGCPPLEGCDPTSLQSGVRALRQAGVFVVVSAGNDGDVGCETVRSPLAIYDEVFSVGASDSRGQVASFSSRGPVAVDGSGRIKPDILAPGVDVLSAFPNGSYEFADGTSMAGPHVAGVVALMWSANPNLIGQIDETEQILRETAASYEFALESSPCANLSPQNIIGSGLVDAYMAVVRAYQFRQ